MLIKGCAKCGKLIRYGIKYCDVCGPIMEAAERARIAEAKARYNHSYNQRRDPKYGRFYNSKEWRMLSAQYSQDHGFRCELCHRVASEVHHKEAIQTEAGWDRRLDYDNLILLCVSCHNDQHRRFQSKKKKKR